MTRRAGRTGRPRHRAAFHDSCSTDAVWLRDNFFRSAAMWGMYRGICNYFGATNTWDSTPVKSSPATSPSPCAPARQRRCISRCATVAYSGTMSGSSGSEPWAIRPVHRCHPRNVGREVPPGDTITFTFDLTAPTTPGTYLTDWQMLREGVQWFGPVVQQQVFVDESVETEPPTIPAGLQATPVSESRVDLSWNASTDNVGVTGYRLYREGTLLAFLTGTSYSDTSCQGYTTYVYLVSEYDASGNGPAVDAVQVTRPRSSTSSSTTWKPISPYPGDASTGGFYGTTTGWRRRRPRTSRRRAYSRHPRPRPYDVYHGIPRIYRPQKARTPSNTRRNRHCNVDQTHGGHGRSAQSCRSRRAPAYVELGNRYGETRSWIVADAVRFRSWTQAMSPARRSRHLGFRALRTKGTR